MGTGEECRRMDTAWVNGLEALPWHDSDRGGRSPCVDTDTDANTGADADANAEVDVEAALRSLDGVIAESDLLRLEPAFRTAWRDRIVEIRDRNARLEELAARLAVDPGRLALAVTADGFEATCDRTRIGLWPSNAAFLAALAAIAVLDERSADWRELEANEQRVVLAALRLFLERCPNCDGAVVGADSEPPAAADSRWRSTEAAVRTTESTAVAGRRVACDRCGVVLVREEPYDDAALVSTVR